MARVVYVGPSDAVELVDGTRCENGVPVDVSADLAASLCEQSVWRLAPPPATSATTPPKSTKPAAAPEKASDA